MKASRKRSIAKAATYRVSSTLITIVIVLMLTGEISISLMAGLFEIIAKIIFYYFHERIWNEVGWGKRSSESNK